MSSGACAHKSLVRFSARKGGELAPFGARLRSIPSFADWLAEGRDPTASRRKPRKSAGFSASARVTVSHFVTQLQGLNVPFDNHDGHRTHTRWLQRLLGIAFIVARPPD